MADITSDAARNDAFCYFGLLGCSGERLEQILKILPESRRKKLNERLVQAKNLTKDEIISRLGSLREQSHPARLVPARVPWRSLSPALLRCLSVHAEEEAYGRQNH